MNLWSKINRKTDPSIYQAKDQHLERTLGFKDLLALGIGTIVSTSIFTLPGIVAAERTGPAVTISFLLAAIVAGFVAMVYAEMASAMPFTGSAYSWINIIFGDFWGWIAGWALLAEYFISIAFQASGISSNFRGLIAPLGINFPKQLSNPMGTNGGVVDIVAIVVILIVAGVLSRGTSQASKVENALVILKIIAILLFIVVGITAIHPGNYTPFIPQFHETAGGPFGGWQGIYAGIAMIFISYTGFDSMAANSAEVKNPQKNIPRGMIGSLLVCAILFIAVSFILVGMFKYTNYAGNSEPVGWALRQIHHGVIASVVQAIAVMGMFTALIGFMLAGSRLLYSFGRDGMLPKKLGKINKKHQPAVALTVVTIAGIVVGAFAPFQFLTQLISAGTLIAFMFVSVGLLSLRKREGKDLPNNGFKVPFFPILPILSFLGTLMVFLGLDGPAKEYSIVWFIIGMIVYFTYSLRHQDQNHSDK